MAPRLPSTLDCSERQCLSNFDTPAPETFNTLDSLLLMFLLTWRWLGAYLSLGSVGWPRHCNVAERGCPGTWREDVHGGAGDIGGAGVGPVPRFVMDYGMSLLVGRI